MGVILGGGGGGAGGTQTWVFVVVFLSFHSFFFCSLFLSLTPFCFWRDLNQPVYHVTCRRECRWR